MTKETLIQRTLTALAKLPKARASEITDFAEYILKNRMRKSCAMEFMN